MKQEIHSLRIRFLFGMGRYKHWIAAKHPCELIDQNRVSESLSNLNSWGRLRTIWYYKCSSEPHSKLSFHSCTGCADVHSALLNNDCFVRRAIHRKYFANSSVWWWLCIYYLAEHSLQFLSASVHQDKNTHFNFIQILHRLFIALAYSKTSAVLSYPRIRKKSWLVYMAKTLCWNWPV